jgi:hypothetical protein
MRLTAQSPHIVRPDTSNQLLARYHGVHFAEKLLVARHLAFVRPRRTRKSSASSFLAPEIDVTG